MTVSSSDQQQPFDRGLTTGPPLDIEDAGALANVKGHEELCCSQVAKPRNRLEDEAGEFSGDSFVPGTKRVFIKTWGCSHNRSDSEYMAGMLAQAGYEITDTPHLADVWLLNSCTVKTPSEDQLRALVHNRPQSTATGQRPPVVLAGCVPQAAPQAQWANGLSVVGVQQIDRVVEVVEETLKGNSVRLLGAKRKGGKRLAGADLNLPKIRKNPLIEILAINTGCLNHCTYCKTKQARGDLASYPIDQLVDRARSAFQEGVKEIWLTSEDLGAYGRDLGVTLPDLLDELVKVIPEGCMMRLGMTNPPYIMDHLPEIAAVLRHPRVYAFLHIPVQSGSDPVLMDMRREYTAQQFVQVVEYMRREVPGVHIATDVICAFPTETLEDFEETYRLIDKYRFPSVFINQFYPRPGTPAAKMPRIDTVEARRRTKLLSDLFRSYHPYEGRVGCVYTVLVTEWASDKKHLVAHNKCYEQILLSPPADGRPLMGATVRVRVTATVGKFAMHALVLDDDEEEEVGRRAQDCVG